MAKLHEYHFDCGNSNKGAIGFCAAVRAHSKAEATDILQSVMPEEYETEIQVNDESGRTLYVTVYFNSENIKPRHIDSVTAVQLCDSCDGPLDDDIVRCPDGAEIHRACFEAGAH